jgi:hypothetical protein
MDLWGSSPKPTAKHGAELRRSEAHLRSTSAARQSSAGEMGTRYEPLVKNPRNQPSQTPPFSAGVQGRVGLHPPPQRKAIATHSASTDPVPNRG